VTVLKGRVEDALTGAPIGASLRVVNLDTGQPYKALSSNPATGRYLITLPSGHAYSLRVQAEGYLFYSEHIEVPEGQGYRERELDIPLALIVEGQQTTLNNIFFRVGSAELLAKSRRELNSLARMLQNNPQLKLAVAGHTDNQGDQQLNQRLSRQRAEAVVDFLVRQGIARKRLKAKGYGQRQPIASNASPAGRARNRRVTIRVLQAE
jgi:outer membrane protein OmpA-like peptidoglycan-associated protein